MVLDGLTIYNSVREISAIAEDAKVTKINMPTKEEVALQLYTKNDGNVRLNIVASGDSSAVFLGDIKKPNPKTPPAFCMLLRKYLQGSRIHSIHSDGMDRSFEIGFESKDEMLHPLSVTLVCELMGKYSNIILLNGDRKVIDAAKRISVDVSSLRQILPGSVYELPPQRQKDILSEDKSSLAAMIKQQSENTPTFFLSSEFAGISRKTAEEIIYRAGIEDVPLGKISDGEKTRLANAARYFISEAVSDPRPCVQTNAEGLPVFVSCLPFDTYPEELRRKFSSVNEALLWYYSKRYELFCLKQRKDIISKQLRKNISKLTKKIKTLEEGIQDSSASEGIINKANIITANIYRLKKGMSGFEAQDLLTGKPVKIALDITLNPAQNAQKLFKKAAKMKKTAEVYSERLIKATEEKEFMDSSLMFTEKAECMDDLAEIESILSDEKVIFLSKTKKTEISEPRLYTSETGYKIYVGRNDKQNDRLTMGMAKKDDIWFHAQKMPGAHVLLVTNGKDISDIDDKTIEYAASLAAKYSSAKLGGKIPVDYTLRSNIKKPPASRPGRVIYNHYWTIYTE